MGGVRRIVVQQGVFALPKEPAKIWAMAANSTESPPSRFQFTIARLMACTLFVAFAAWAATVGLPLTLSVSPLGKRNVLPFVLATLLLAAAVGVLLRGKPGASDGVRIGCALLIGAATLLSIGLTLKELFDWLARQM